MPKICFVMLTMLILSLFYCDAQNAGSGYNDGSHSNDVESFWEKLVNKARFLWNAKTSIDPTKRTKLMFDNDLVTIDKRKGASGINGSFIVEATSRSSSCAIASIPCSCASATGTCTCASTGCTCTVAPCTFGAATSGSSSSSSSGSSSSSSSGSGGSAGTGSSSSSSSGSSSSSSSSGSASSSSSNSSTSSSSSLSISKVCLGVPTCTCTTTTCTNGACSTAPSVVNPSANCTAYLG